MKNLRVLVVTSEVTYVPQNYLSLFETLVRGAGSQLAGLILLKGLDPQLLKTTAGLYALGARRVAKTLTKNIVDLPKRTREKLFLERGIPVLRAKTMNDPSIVKWVVENDIDLILNLRTRCIYKKEILEAPRLGCLNVHHGLLPKYRGTLCDLYALSENRPAGFSIHLMNQKLDDGRILKVGTVSRGGDRDYISYLERTGREEGKALVKLIHETRKTGALPEGRLNQSQDAIFTKTPRTRKEISQLKKRGMIL